MFGVGKKTREKFENMDMSGMSAGEIYEMRKNAFYKLVLAMPFFLIAGLTLLTINTRKALLATCFSGELTEAISNGDLEFTIDTEPLRDVRMLVRTCKEKRGVLVDENAIMIPMDTYRHMVLTHLECDPQLAADQQPSAVCREIDRKWHQRFTALKDSQGLPAPHIFDNDAV